tara:strand:- start:124 stop:1788 length:1665 start_codon:yes stop_codon:yes gene_type:complete
MENKKLTFHVLGLPHTITNKDFIACAYTQKAWKFCKMMGERGHTLYHYGHEKSNPPYAENVTVITDKIWEKVYGTHDYKSKLFTYNTQDEAYQTFYKNAIEEIGKRKNKNDFILPFWGTGVKPICDAHPDLINVEPGIGYAKGHWANWKIFESYAIYHAYCNLESVGTCKQNNYDIVIPNYFDLDEFEFNSKKEDYFLFLGRVYDGKGVNIAMQVTEHLGYKLKIAGQIDEEGPYRLKQFPPHVEFVGYADEEKRKTLMKNAKGSFLASQYLEPFGGVQIENLLCGTPTITSDWGAFTENNIEGVTGYRCRTFDDYLKAAISINGGEIDYYACREHGEKFSLDSIAPKYEKFFKDVLNVYESGGWYETDIPKAKSNDFDYDKMDDDERPFSINLAKWIKKYFKPKEVVDIGCGSGLYVDSLRDQKIKTVGYDINPIVEGKKYLTKKSIFDINHKSELIICLEVAEHIETKHNDEIVKSLYNNLKPGGTLIFTAAFPGQQGIGHINCQSKEYWLEKFVDIGLIRDTKAEDNWEKTMSKKRHMGWFRINKLIFTKQ